MKHPILVAPPPSRVIIPIRQCLGHRTDPLVRVGQDVLAGEPIASAVAAGVSPKLHASISGKVAAIREHAVPGSGHASETCIFIDGDGRDASYSGYSALGDPLQLSPERICELVAEAGIVGLGGALYSTAGKLASRDGVHTLILNGTECEPYITCDEMLMREQAQRILLGARIMMRAVGATRTIVGIESDMPEARVAVWDVIEAEGLDDVFVSVVTAKYPAGGERQLIQLITDEEVPEGGLPSDIGILCQNVGTAAAVADLFSEGRPLISRVVTVTGRGVAEPVNICARIGTPMVDLLRMAGGLSEDASHLIMGGPMMGTSVPSPDVPITKATNCLIAMTPAEISPTLPEMPCIRCGECSQVCPAQLMPQELLAADRRHDMSALTELGLDACIECGCCDYVCPSQILLTDRFVDSKARLREFRRERDQAERARRRFDAREARLAEVESTREAELQKQVDDLQQADSIDDVMARVTARSDDAGGDR